MAYKISVFDIFKECKHITKKQEAIEVEQAEFSDV